MIIEVKSIKMKGILKILLINTVPVTLNGINNVILNYYKYMEKGEMKVYEKEALIREYEIYEKLGGNSFISSCYEELMELPTKK